MESARRSFIKVLGGSFLSFTINPGHSLAESFRSENEIQASPQNSSNGVDSDLHFLGRDTGALPSDRLGYFSTFYGVIFRLKDFDLKNRRAVFFLRVIKQNPGQEPKEAEMSFSVNQTDEKISFASLDGQILFFWKPRFGFYAVDNQDLERVVELCPPLTEKLAYKGNYSVDVAMDLQDQLSCHCVRSSFWEVGVPQSPLKGFQGFTEEMIWVDSQENRDEIVAKANERFLNNLPFGLIALKALAKIAPETAATAMETILPQAFAWMIGPYVIAEPGKVVITDCPYRVRLGTLGCESTCGHALGKFFTDQIGIPLRFDPTVDGYTKCHLLIGKPEN